MTWALVKRAIESPAGGSDKLILILMANHADAKTGRCWASLSTLSGESGLTERGISKVINRLETGGYLTRETVLGKRTYYTLTPELSSDVPLNTVHPRTEFTPELSSVTPELSSDEPLTNPVLKKEPPLTPPPRERTHQPRGARLPHKGLPLKWEIWAREHGHLTPEAEWEIFHDYWIAQPGQKGVKLDWLATWRNWIRRSKTNGRKQNGGGRLSAPERVAEANRLREANRQAHGQAVGADDGAVREPLDGEFWKL